jgi:hypothetical protein
MIAQSASETVCESVCLRMLSSAVHTSRRAATRGAQRPQRGWQSRAHHSPMLPPHRPRQYHTPSALHQYFRSILPFVACADVRRARVEGRRQRLQRRSPHSMRLHHPYVHHPLTMMLLHDSMMLRPAHAVRAAPLARRCARGSLSPQRIAAARGGRSRVSSQPLQRTYRYRRDHCRRCEPRMLSARDSRSVVSSSHRPRLPRRRTARRPPARRRGRLQREGGRSPTPTARGSGARTCCEGALQGDAKDMRVGVRAAGAPLVVRRSPWTTA